MRTAGLVLTACLLAQQPVPPPQVPPKVAGPTSGLARLPAVETASYRVFGRIRLLVAWVGRRDVGEARIAWLQDGQGRGYELLIGTDPERAPFRLNKWGYVLEELTPEGSTLLGLMTEADAASVGEARKDVEKTDGDQVFKRIRGTVKGADARSEISIALVNPARSYHDLRPLLQDLPVRLTSEKRLTLVPGIRPGMLAAIAELLHTDATARAAGNRARRPNGRPRLPYVYNAMLYDLTLDDSRVIPDARFHGTLYGELVEADFVVLNRSTRERTEFTICYTLDGADKAAPSDPMPGGSEGHAPSIPRVADGHDSLPAEATPNRQAPERAKAGTLPSDPPATPTVTETTERVPPIRPAVPVVPVRIVYRPKWWLELELVRVPPR